MRYNEFNISDPIDELSDRLVRLGHGPMDFNVIKRLINRISVKHKMPTEKLHHMFVQKYGHSPESWAKKIKQRNEDTGNEKKLPWVLRNSPLDDLIDQMEAEFLELSQSEDENLTETDEGSDIEQINQFIAWAKEQLHVQGEPKFTFSKDTDKAQEGHHTGVHSGNDIWVYIGNRNLIDILRTVFHELVHQRQEELNMIEPGDSYPGSPIEAMADMLAGKYIKIYGKEHPEIFQ